MNTINLHLNVLPQYMTGHGEVEEQVLKMVFRPKTNKMQISLQNITPAQAIQLLNAATYKEEKNG